GPLSVTFAFFSADGALPFEDLVASPIAQLIWATTLPSSSTRAWYGPSSNWPVLGLRGICSVNFPVEASRACTEAPASRFIWPLLLKAPMETACPVGSPLKLTMTNTCLTPEAITRELGTEPGARLSSAVTSPPLTSGVDWATASKTGPLAPGSCVSEFSFGP